jgi:hypothetical protein
VRDEEEVSDPPAEGDEQGERGEVGEPGGCLRILSLVLLEGGYGGIPVARRAEGLCSDTPRTWTRRR